MQKIDFNDYFNIHLYNNFDFFIRDRRLFQALYIIYKNRKKSSQCLYYTYKNNNI